MLIVHRRGACLMFLKGAVLALIMCIYHFIKCKFSQEMDDSTPNDVVDPTLGSVSPGAFITDGRCMQHRMS